MHFWQQKMQILLMLKTFKFHAAVAWVKHSNNFSILSIASFGRLKDIFEFLFYVF